MSDTIHAEPITEEFCGLYLTHNAFPNDRIRFRFPEGIVYYDEEDSFQILSFGHSRPEWTRREDGTLTHRRPWESIVEYEVAATPAGETLKLSVSVINISSQPISRVQIAPCIQLASAPSLDDPAMTRTFYRAGDAFLSIAKANRPNDPGKNQFSVTSEIGFRWTLGQSESDYGWGLASPDADAGLIAVISRDRAGGLATYWQRVATLANNAAAPIHCIHAEPYFDILTPGETRTNLGELVWSRKTSLDELWNRYLSFCKSNAYP